MPRAKLKPKMPDLSEIVDLETAAVQLGKGFSLKSMMRRIESGEWQEGIHWFDCRRMGTSRRRIRINLEAVRESWATPAVHRDTTVYE